MKVTEQLRVFLRTPQDKDLRRFLKAVRKSRALHKGWVTPPCTPRAYRDYLKRTDSAQHFVVDRETGGLVGMINLNNVVLGNFLNAALGYYAFAGFAGRGLMKEGMLLVLSHAFQDLGLHRVEANIQPGNKASLALVRSCGFVKEGFSRKMLKVGGRWRDHERWALLAEEFPLVQR
jgi:[ribosomal protein S5]-alanine N-acetyltransferase